MATLAADSTAATTEVRRAPVALTSLGGLVLVGGAVLLAVTAGLAKTMSGDDNHILDRFWHAYLLGASYAASLALGGLFFVIAHHLTGGRWGTSLRRIAEIVASTMPYIALLFLPILANVMMTDAGRLYAWDDPTYVQGDTVLESKAIYLNDKWFAIRTVAYFAIFIMLANFYVGGSVKQDDSGSVATLRNLSRWSGPSMMLFAMTLNFAAFDWLMSLAPHWFSTIFGVYYFAGSFLGFMALLILLSSGLQQIGVLSHSITTDNRHDAAKLLYAFVIFWGYIAFSQFMLIWYANVPEETEWFWARQAEKTTVIGIPWALGLLFIVHLFVPFLGFMSSAVRRNRLAMTFWAAYMLVVHFLDLVFIVMPGMHGYEEYSVYSLIGPLEIACVVGAVAVLLGAVLRSAEDKWLLPVRDPRLHQATTYHNH